MSNLYRFSLKDNKIEKIFNTENFIFSIAFCKETNGIFYSDMNQNGIMMLSLPDGDVRLWRAHNIIAPKSICLNKDHTVVFFEDNNNGVSAFGIDGSIFTRMGSYAHLDLEFYQNKRNTLFKNLTEKEKFYKVNCMTYIDELDYIAISIYYKNIINYIDKTGQMYKAIGNGRKDFCPSSNPSSVAFNHPTGLVFIDYLGELFVSDTDNHIIRRFSVKNNWKENKIVGMPLKDGDKDDVLVKSTFKFPSELCCFEKNIFVIDDCGNKIRKIDLDKNKVSTIYKTKNFIKSITCDNLNNIYWTELE